MEPDPSCESIEAKSYPTHLTNSLGSQSVEAGQERFERHGQKTQDNHYPRGKDSEQETDNNLLRDKLVSLLTCVKLIDPSSPLPPVLSPPPSAQSLESHLLFKPITLDSGYSLCSACYDIYPHELPATSHHQPSPQSSPAFTLDDHRHLAQPSPTVNFVLQKLVHLLRTSLALNPADHVSIRASLRAELECPLCAIVFDSPVTISCGHTFCRSCFLRARDHADHCPICREPFLMGPQAIPCIDLMMEQIIEQCLTPAHTRSAVATNLETNQTIPLMICSIGFPQVPMFLQIFEPRYKLLIRRSLSTDRKFGIVIPACNHQTSDSQFNHPLPTVISPTARETHSTLPVHPFGTILEIRKHETAIDGRMLIEARGCDRFMIEGLLGSLDGYLVAKIHVFGDMPIHEARLSSQAKSQTSHHLQEDHHHHLSLPNHLATEPSTAKLMNTCKEFIEVLRSGSSPWVLERLHDTFGPMPDQPAEFTYWVAMVLPISDHYKAALLPIISYRSRLKILVRWIEVLKSQWNSRGCLIV